MLCTDIRCLADEARTKEIIKMAIQEDVDGIGVSSLGGTSYARWRTYCGS